MFKFYGVRIDDGKVLASRSDYYLVTNLERDVFMISPFFPSNIFGNTHAYFDEMYVYSYGRDTYTMNNLKWRCSTEGGFHEISNVDYLTGIFHAKTILMKRGDECWIVTTTANMQHSCYDGVYNIYMRRKIHEEDYQRVISTYDNALHKPDYKGVIYFGNELITGLRRLLRDEDANDPTKSGLFRALDQELSREWKLYIGTDLPGYLFEDPRLNNVIVCTNEVNFKLLGLLKTKVKCVYYSKSDIAKVYNENCCKSIPRVRHECKNHIKMYITDDNVYFGSMNLSMSASSNVESLSVVSNTCIRECVERWLKDLVNYEPDIDAVPHDGSSEILSVRERLQGDRACEQEVQGSPRDVPLQSRRTGK